jgi:hypothetical protein
MSKDMSQEEANLAVATALMREVMDLQAEVQRLRACAEALEKIASSPTGGIGCNPAELVKVARAALDALEEPAK